MTDDSSHSASEVPPGIADLRHEVRDLLVRERDSGSFVPTCNAWLEAHDPSFSKKLGQRGWLGMTWPTHYGGAGRSGLERFVVIEELLAAGAPVAAHWIAERQTGPSLLKFGSELQKSQFLPSIARGETYFAIGMSEPDSGSDLASVRTSARRQDEGWLLSGTKIWMSHGSRAHYAMVLCRTSDKGEDRHSGLSQFIVDLAAPGVHIRPINLMSGHAHFSEVIFDSVVLSDEMLVGLEGSGWQQVNAELAYERSGPERFLSTYPLLRSLSENIFRDKSRENDTQLGMAIANLWALHSMSQSVAAQLDAGVAPQLEAAMVKDLGTQFENDVVELANLISPRELSRQPRDTFSTLLSQSVLAAPGFTLRGGTTEILRGIIAKGLKK